MSRVLVADDDADIRELVMFKLEQDGHEVVAVGDGGAALAALQDARRPDLLLLDVMMPRRTGLEVLGELRQRTDMAHLPVILLTARAQEADVERGFSLGADDYIVKPFSPRELLSRVRNVLGRAAAP